MNHKFLPLKVFLLLATLSLSQMFCGQFVQTDSPTPDPGIMATSIAATLTAQAVSISPTVTTEQATQTATLQPTETESQQPVQTEPVIPEAASISVSLDTNCREGPAKDYQKLGYLLPGQTAAVIGRNSNSTWWYIENPKKPGQFCWVWGEYATLQGDISTLPVTTPPPPPIPVAGYVNTEYDFYLEPGGWSANETYPNVLKLTNGEYYLTICYEKLSESNVCRTGVPAGDWANGGFFQMLGNNFRKDLIVYQNKIKVASYGAGPIELDGLRLQIWLDSSNSNYDAIDIPNEILDQADKILASFGLSE
jgi:hypothetical protein